MPLPESLRRLMVSAEMPIMDAIQRLNDAHKRIVLAVDDDDRLQGVLTDSNVRHAILNHVDFQRPIRDIMAAEPISVSPDTSEDAVLHLMEQTTVYQIPVIDSDRRVIDVMFLDDILRRRSQSQNRVAVVMAGGLGKRLTPLTLDTPKPLLKVGDKPILFVILDGLLNQGFNKIFLTLNYKAEMIRAAVMAEQRFHGVVEFVEETKALGTAGALSLLPTRPTSSFVVLNGDLLTKVAADEMLRFHRLEGNSITVAVKEENFSIPYGVAKLEGTRIVRMDEKPSFVFFLNAGIYVVEPSILDRLSEDAASDMTDVVNDALAQGRRVGCFPVHEYWQDIGVPAQLEQARQDYDALFPVQSSKP